MNYRQSSRGIPYVKSIIVVLLSMILGCLLIGCPLLDALTSITDELITLTRVEISNSVGLGLVGDTIQVIEIDPEEAEVTFQWQRSIDGVSDFVDIEGASSESYELQIDDVDNFVRVAVTGSGDYKGTVDSVHLEVLSTPRTINIPEITSIEVPVVGNTPVKNFYTEQYFAQVAWSPTHTLFRAATAYTATISINPKYGYTCDGVSEDFFTVEGATSTSNEADSNKVTASYTKTGNTALVSISGITGTLEIRQAVTAGSLSPGGATATYRWLISDELEGEYVPIEGKTEASYTINDLDLHKFLKVEAMGTGGYTGTVTSVARGPIKQIPLTQLGNITGTARVGNTLTMGTVWPTEATVVYFWLSSPTADGVYSEITHAPDSKEFKPTVEELNLYIKGRVEGIGLFDGVEETDSCGPVVAGELEGIGEITGKRLINEQLSAGNLQPIEATASYQWQFSDTKDGIYENIPGDLAKLSTYVVEPEYWEKFIRVSATGTNGYDGTVISNPIEITYSIGDQTDGGGYIFFNKGLRDNTIGHMEDVWNPIATTTKEWRYLEAAPAEWQGSDDPTYAWDSSEIDNYWVDENIDVEDLNQLLGGGLENTSKLISSLGDKAEAANACANYSLGDGGEWYLGNTSELSYMMNHIASDDLGLTGSKYWSSNQRLTEGGLPNDAYYVDLFGSYISNYHSKGTSLHVRPIRMF